MIQNNEEKSRIEGVVLTAIKSIPHLANVTTGEIVVQMTGEFGETGTADEPQNKTVKPLGGETDETSAMTNKPAHTSKEGCDEDGDLFKPKNKAKKAMGWQPIRDFSG